MPETRKPTWTFTQMFQTSVNTTGLLNLIPCKCKNVFNYHHISTQLLCLSHRHLTTLLGFDYFHFHTWSASRKNVICLNCYCKRVHVFWCGSKVKQCRQVWWYGLFITWPDIIIHVTDGDSKHSFKTGHILKSLHFIKMVFDSSLLCKKKTHQTSEMDLLISYIFQIDF